jgi:hypothetical protein
MELDAAKTQEMSHFQKISTEQHGKCFAKGPLPLV